MLRPCRPIAAPPTNPTAAVPASCKPFRSATPHSSARCSSIVCSSSVEQQHAEWQAVSSGEEGQQCSAACQTRRGFLLAGVTAAAAAGLAGGAQQASAIQGITAGRLPGVSKEADADGFYTYQRPEGKSGGHGVGWSEIPRYSFKLPEGWAETPVSIADLGGTELDLRYENQREGDLAIVVAPVLRFKDVGFNANVTLEDLGPPDKLILGFAPELIGGPLPDDGVINQQVLQKDGRTYYEWEVDVKGATKPYHLISCTAVGNRAFLITVAANGRQWKRAQDKLRRIQTSFYVPPKASSA